MVDLYLQEMMLGHISSIKEEKVSKDKYDLQIEDEINRYIESLDFDEEEPKEVQLYSKEMKKAKIKAELKESLKISEISNFLNLAVLLLRQESRKYLDPFSYNLLMENMNHAYQILENQDLNNNDLSNIEVLKITSSSIDSIFDLGIVKFKEAQYENALALFLLLSILIPGDFDYWYRAAIAAYQSGNINLAIRLYETTSTLYPSFIGSALFLAQCYLIIDNKYLAVCQMEKIEKIQNQYEEIDPSWQELILMLKEELKNKQ